MNIFDVLYSLIINPLILVFDVIFSVTLEHLRYVGWSIVILSLVINTLVLPLYNRADELQANESEKKKKIKKWEDHIKHHFKGDERFMMLQTYYRQNDYKPYHTLRGALPLLLEIPFFIAAYKYLSGLQLLAGYSFGPIKDLSVPDNIINISGVNINVMPILMTIINLISSLIYNRSTSLRDKAQLYVIAFVFLALLYNCPSGLVLYWTCNNIYSLCKNLIYRFVIKDKNIELKYEKKNKNIILLFIGSSLILAFLVGTYVPLDLIEPTLDEFIDFDALINPAMYVLNSTFIALGLFFVWLGVYFYLSREKGRKVIAISMISLCIIAFIDYVIIPFDSSMTCYLTVDTATKITSKLVVQNVLVIVAVVFLCIFIIKYKEKAFGLITLFTLIPFVFVCGFSFIKVYSMGSQKIEMIKKYDAMPELHLSKNGKNVVVIMMDRMIGYYVPFIMNEHPELYDSWGGFTYYPNSISYGSATNVGSPALFGGYDYRPEKINERSDEKLVDKQNEALCVMPVLFGEHGFDVTVGNPTYAGYSWIPDLSIYDDYPYVYKYNTGKTLNSDSFYYPYEDVIIRNLVCYGIYRVSPIFLQPSIYNGGNYNSKSTSFVNGIGLCVVHTFSTSDGISSTFFDAYNVLLNLDNISIISDDDTNHFNMFSNDTTHEACLLSEPDYELSSIVDNTNYDLENSVRYSEDGKSLDLYVKDDSSSSLRKDHALDRVLNYHTDTAAMLKLGEWFDYLRENGVYDNTRIIVVSDHGAPNCIDDNFVCWLTFDESDVAEVYDMFGVQSCLLVKDFDSKTFETSDEFMTNADVPYLASKDLINNPTNPFSGNRIDDCSIKQGKQNIVFTSSWHTDENDGYKLRKSQWFSVHDNIFDINNWKYEGAH